jgi:hypothetical protein
LRDLEKKGIYECFFGQMENMRLVFKKIYGEKSGKRKALTNSFFIQVRKKQWAILLEFGSSRDQMKVISSNIFFSREFFGVSYPFLGYRLFPSAWFQICNRESPVSTGS